MNLEEKIRNSLLVIVLLAIVTTLSYSVYHNFTIDQHIHIHDCGIIKSKSTDEVIIKYGTNTELYLNIQFEKVGFRAQQTDPTTYFKYKVGDKVCFDWEQRNPEYDNLWGIIGDMTCAMSTIVATLALIYYLIGGFSSKKE